MFESIILASLVTGVTALSTKIPKRKMKDKAKINRLFHIAKIAVPNKENKPEFPKFLRQEEKTDYVSYTYKLPLGIPSKLIIQFQEVLSEGLGKPVEIDYNNYILNIKVFKRELPFNIEFDYRMCRMNSWKVVIGQSLDGLVYHDFEKTPNTLIGGNPGYGKSQLLHTINTQLLVQNGENIDFYIVDLKGKLEFQAYEYIKQCKAVAGNVLETLLVLMKVVADLNKTIEFLRSKGIKNISDSPIKKRKFIVVDEIADLAPGGMDKFERELCIDLLTQIARKGRAAGFRLIVATQYPLASVVGSTLKAVCDAKIGFRLTSVNESKVIIDTSGLEQLPFLEELPDGTMKGAGRIIYKTDRLQTLQVPHVSKEQLKEVLKYNENQTGKPNRIDPTELKMLEISLNQSAPKNNKGPKGKKKQSKDTQNNGGKKVSFGDEVRK